MTFIRLRLFGFFKKLPKKTKYLEIFFYNHVSLENNFHIPQKLPAKANDNLFSPQF